MIVRNRLYLTVLVVILQFLVITCSSSNNCSRIINRSYFTISGKVFFGKSSEISLKELHLDLGKLNDKLIIVSGMVQFIAENGTYFILADESGRALVLTHKIYNSNINILIGSKIRLLGFLDRGKRGVPVIVAESIRIEV